MTPKQCKESIIAEHRHLLDMVRQGKLNQSAVSGIIESSCMLAARHNGIPECWREYLPEKWGEPHIETLKDFNELMDRYAKRNPATKKMNEDVIYNIPLKLENLLQEETNGKIPQNKRKYV